MVLLANKVSGLPNEVVVPLSLYRPSSIVLAEGGRCKLINLCPPSPTRQELQYCQPDPKVLLLELNEHDLLDLRTRFTRTIFMVLLFIGLSRRTRI
jgi:hypothetical protein